MKTLTAKQDKVQGFWRIRANGKTVGALVQPNYEVSLGILPTANAIRDAVISIKHELHVTAETNVIFE